MKAKIKTISIVVLALLLFTGCLKKSYAPVEMPIPTTDPPEIITTLRLSIIDSADVTQTAKLYAYKDPDGDGGVIGSFLNESGTYDTIILIANHSYFTKIYILDETKIPTDSISNIIGGEESGEHMLFYNGDPASTGNASNTILNSNVPYTIKTNGSNVTIKYLDTDNGTTQRNIGLQTLWRTTSSTGSTVNPIIVFLRHQPNTKDGTYASGETDVQVEFKVKIN